jgi:methyltransferase
VSAPQWIVLAVAALRVAELVYADRNSRHLLAEGGREIGAGHYPLFILLHGGWLAALFFLVPAEAPIHAVPLAIFGALLAARAWTVLSLGGYWTTRIITLPGAALVRAGPYRFVRHPNYLVVAGEIAVLPLVFGAWPIALLFSLLNAALLRHRIRVEDGALAARRPIRP